MAANNAAPSLTILLFGPLEVRVSDQPLPRLRFRKSEAVLALLALRRGGEVDRGWLAGLLWPESRDSQALRNCLTDLRRALGAEAHRLTSPTPHTLRLEFTDATVDAVDFDAAMERGDPGSLAEAVALYRGPLLEGCVEEWAFQERQAREQAYLAARERLSALALERGDTAEAERHLRMAVRMDPLRESVQRALMQVLAASGNYAAALLCYRELRLRLHRELNAEPDGETQTLFQQLRSEARRLADKSSGGPTRGPRAVHPAAAGATVAEQDQATAGPTVDTRPVDTPAAARRNLPMALTCFIGREAEKAEVRRRLGMTRLLSITGAGGCGNRPEGTRPRPPGRSRAPGRLSRGRVAGGACRPRRSQTGAAGRGGRPGGAGAARTLAVCDAGGGPPTSDAPPRAGQLRASDRRLRRPG